MPMLRRPLTSEEIEKVLNCADVIQQGKDTVWRDIFGPRAKPSPIPWNEPPADGDKKST